MDIQKSSVHMLRTQYILLLLYLLAKARHMYNIRHIFYIYSSLRIPDEERLQKKGKLYSVGN
jgi:hypothetical protein